MDNLRRLDKCTEEFTAKVQEMMNALSEYWTVRNAELQGVREELVNSIDKAVKEAEETIYEESPKLRFPLSRQMREFQRGTRSLRLFEYSIYEGNFLSSLENVLIIANSMHESEASVLPFLSQQGVSLYNLVESKLEKELQHPILTGNQEITMCQINKDNLFAINGHSVSLLDIAANKRSFQQSTFRCRKCAGVIKFGNQVYAFGGLGEKSAEKYDLGRNRWQKLGDMSRSLSHFVPAVYQRTAYLVDFGCGDVNSVEAINCTICLEENPALTGKLASPYIGYPYPQAPPAPKKTALQVEVFCFLTESFKTLEVSLPENIAAVASVAFVCNAELVVVSASNAVYRWEIDSKAIAFVASAPLQPENIAAPQQYVGMQYGGMQYGQQPYVTPILSSTVVLQAGKYFWYNSSTQQISIYDSTSKSIAAKPIR